MSADTLRVLTVRQPWAWAIIHGGKDIENRVRSLGPYRGPVAIHVAGAYAVDGLDLPALTEACDAWCKEAGGFWHKHPWLRSVGHVIGVVDLVGEHHADDVTPTFCGICPEGCCGCSPWAMPDHHHLELANPRPLPTPIPATGRLGLWRPDDDLAAAIWQGLHDHDPVHDGCRRCGALPFEGVPCEPPVQTVPHQEGADHG